MSPYPSEALRTTLLWTLAGLAVLAGCSDPNASRETATVTGKVLLFGKPPSNGTITFDSRNPSREDTQPVTVDIQSDGTYSLEATLGTNRVFLDSKEIQTDPRLNQYRGGGELSCLVAKGANHQDFIIGGQP
jgi:hypothetical protein